MIYSDLTKLAMRICFDAHKDQVDKSGVPYVFHPYHLAEQMEDEATTVVALLHDVVEDSQYTLDDLRDAGFPEYVLEAVTLVTHKRGVPYMDYIMQLKGNEIARKVKLADLRHNSDLSRLGEITEKDLYRTAKYKKAIELLE